MKIEEILIAWKRGRDAYEINVRGRPGCDSLTFSTIASELIGECHVPYGAAFGLIAD